MIFWNNGGISFPGNPPSVIGVILFFDQHIVFNTYSWVVLAQRTILICLTWRNLFYLLKYIFINNFPDKIFWSYLGFNEKIPDNSINMVLYITIIGSYIFVSFIHKYIRNICLVCFVSFKGLNLVFKKT